MKRLLMALLIVAMGCTSPGAGGAEAPASQPAAPGLTVAVLDFESTAPGNEKLGAQISEITTALLTSEVGFTLVDRSALARVLQEHELNLTGLVSTDQAVQVGKLVGARIMITGKAFVLGDQMFITGKIIGTETSLVEGVLVKDKVGANLDNLVVQLAQKLTDRLREAGPELLPPDDKTANMIAGLKEALAKTQRPTVAVVVTERHVAWAGRVIDPAVETELKQMFIACGFTVKDVADNELADWAKQIKKDQGGAWPATLVGVDLVVTGEAFSEFAARIGNLNSCSARAEVNVIERSDGKIVFADSQTTRAVDLSEQIAGKKALQKAGNLLGLKLLDHLAKTLPAAKDAGR